MILAAFALGTLGKLSNISDIVAYATILWVGGILLVSFGWKTGKHFWPPVLHLVYMLPLPGVLYFKLNTWLQLVSSELGVFLPAAGQCAGLPGGATSSTWACCACTWPRPVRGCATSSRSCRFPTSSPSSTGARCGTRRCF